MKTQLVMLACALILGSLILVADASAQPVIAQGDRTCDYGSVDCNRWAYDIERQFIGLPNIPNGRFKFSTRAGERISGTDQPLLPISEVDIEGLEKNTGHIQGFSRLPGVGSNEWFVASINSKKRRLQPSGLMFVQMGSPTVRNKNARLGGQLSQVGEVDRFFGGPPNRSDRAEYFFPVVSETNGKNAKHPSGFQPLGQTIPIPSYGNDEHAYVQFVLPSLRTVRTTGGLRQLELFAISVGQLRLADAGRWVTLNAGKVFAGAAAKLADGRFLMILLRSDYGHLQYCVSNRTSLSAARWSEHRVDDTSVGRYQNMALVTECTSGDLYLIGMKWLKDGDGDK